MNILILDDEPHIVENLERLLSNLNYQNVHIAYTPNKALETVENETLDLIFADINLESYIDGIEVVKKIQQIQPNISIIYLTSYNDETIRNRMLETNPDRFIQKPYKDDDIAFQLKIIENKKTFQKSDNKDLLYFADNAFSYNIQTKELCNYDVPIKLRPKEKKLMELIIKNLTTKLLTFDQIIYTVWTDTPPSDVTVRRTISDFNKKLNYQALKSNYDKNYSILL